MSTTFPPAGYEQVPSTIPGILVYQQASLKDGHQEVVAFSCVQCGASTAYCSDNGGLSCTHCGHYEAPQETHITGKGSEELEFTLETVQRASQGWGVEKIELVCGNCGGHTILAPQHLTHTCPFCHSHNVVQQKAPQDALRPRFLIPIQVKSQDLRVQLQEWMGNNWFLPKDLSSIAQGTDLVPIYVPFWTIDARAKARWKAEVGKRVKVGDSYKTVWRWESGWVETNFDDLTISGSTQLEPKLVKKINTFDLEGLVPYDPNFLAGVNAQAYEVSLDDAWAQARSEMRESMKESCLSQTSMGEVRNFHMGLDFSEESWRYILLPFLIGSYSYNEKPYQLLVNGQNRQIAGNRPADWRKVWLLSFLSMLPGAVLLLTSLLFPEFKEQLLTIGIGALVIATATAIYSIVTASRLQKI